MFKCFICKSEINGEDRDPGEPFDVLNPATGEGVLLCVECYKDSTYACASCGQDFVYVNPQPEDEDGHSICGHVNCYNHADSHPSNFDNVARDRHGNPWSDQFSPGDFR